MKKMLAVVMTGTMMAAAVAADAQGRRGGAGRGSCQGLASVAAGTLDAAETAGLVFTREEEKLARDVYLALHDTWQAAVFVQIAGSEQRHMDAVKRLLDRYGIADPAGSNAAGVFSEPRLASLYTELVAKGRLSLTDALAVGATIEDLDIHDVNALLEASDNADLDLVYGNLARGSRNHLRSFATQLTAAGVTYTPQYISAEEYAGIVGSSWERGGRGQGGGRGGAGQGRGGSGAGNGTCDGTGPGPGSGQGNSQGGQGTGSCDGSGRK